MAEKWEYSNSTTGPIIGATALTMLLLLGTFRYPRFQLKKLTVDENRRFPRAINCGRILRSGGQRAILRLGRIFTDSLMPIKRASCQRSKSLEGFYEDVAGLD
jgi:hypothetical protein